MLWCVSQLIYKKTILPCPLPFFYQHESNMSMNGSETLGLYSLRNASALAYISDAHPGPHAPVHDPLHSAVQFTPHPDDQQDMCTPKYFVFNSQVTAHVHVTEPVRRVSVCGKSLTAFVCLCFRPCTPFPSSPSPSSVILRFCPSTANSKSEKNIHNINTYAKYK